MKRAVANYGQGIHDLSHAEPPLFPCGEVRLEFVKLFRSPDYRPPLLPAVALELLELTRKPRVSTAQVAKLLASDPLLAGQVLRIAQSAMYSRGEPLRSLDQALVRLGLDRVTDIFFRACLDLKVFRAPGFDKEMETLRAHSVLTAEATVLVCRHSVGFDEYAYLCGLLHDVGAAACILTLSELNARGRKFDLESAVPCLLEAHESASELIAKIWGLPADVCLVLGLHHRLAFDGHVHPLAAAIALADGLVSEVGFGFHNESSLALTESAAQCIGVDAASLDRLRRAVELVAEKYTAGADAGK